MSSSWRVAAGIAAAGLVFRLLLIPAYLYRSTDFEVHRNWLAITHSLPFSRWYYEETSQWTLDYPPLFAYFEWTLSQCAALVDPEMLRVENLEYASKATVVFQRVSVIAGDMVLLVGARAAGAASGDASAGLIAMALVLFNPALLIVDHIHFQYNGMLLGVMLLSVADIQKGHFYRGSILFCVLLNMKQIFLYVAPVFFVYLLRAHCGLTFQGKVPSLRLGAFVRLGVTVLGCFAICWAPILATGQAAQAASRLFPFGRGLTHAYWAPNIWALYNTADRVLAKLGFGGQQGHSSTSGFAEVYESSVVWTVPPKVTFVLTALAYVPLLVVIWNRTPLPPRTVAANGGKSEFLAGEQGVAKGSFLTYVALGCAVSFGFGWHVHEKAILMVTVPLLVAAAAAGSRAGGRLFIAGTAVLSLIGTFSILPLMPGRPTETVLKWVLLFFGHALELLLLQASQQGSGEEGGGCLALLRMGPLPGWLLLLPLALLGFYSDFGGHERIFGPQRMEFLPLMLISDFCACLVLWSFVRIFLAMRRQNDDSASSCKASKAAAK